MEQTQTITADGTVVPLYWYKADKPEYCILLSPAVGIQAKLYQKLAAELAGQGCSTCLLEQRGHGLSPLRPGYSNRYTLSDALEQDLPAAISFIRKQLPDTPLYLAGHSLGGHLSTLYAGKQPDQIAGVIHLACAFPYYKDYGPKEQRLLRFLCSIMPVFSVFPGYYPGKLMGFGGKESLGVMQQWCQWARNGSFDFDGHNGLADAVAQFTGPVLSISFDRDNFSTEAALERALSPFTHADISRQELGEREQGQHLGHVGWARGPTGVTQSIMRWLQTPR